MCFSPPILLPPRFLNLKAGIGSLLPRTFPPSHLASPSFYFSFFFELAMPASSCELPPISVNLPRTNAVMGDIPLESSTSPSSLAADDEQLTVRPCLATFHSLANIFSLQSKPFITLTTENPSLCVLFVVTASVDARFTSLRFQFDIVNKRRSLTELDSDVEKVEPVPGNILGRISKVSRRWVVPAFDVLMILTRRQSSFRASLSKRDV